ncbi:hypothetical protein DSUL_130018 [Desulfovibrionales bacterium]
MSKMESWRKISITPDAIVHIKCHQPISIARHQTIGRPRSNPL